jgi:hypothetical protein
VKMTVRKAAATNSADTSAGFSTASAYYIRIEVRKIPSEGMEFINVGLILRLLLSTPYLGGFPNRFTALFWALSFD